MSVEAVRNRLVGYIVAGGPETDTKWQEKAVKSLVKKVTKSNQLAVLERAISEQDSSTPCITINRSQDGRLQVGTKKGWPHVFYCQLWRWPDLHTQHELKPIPTCTHSFHKKMPEVCVNPYHYVRIHNPPIMVPNYIASTRSATSPGGCLLDDRDFSIGSGRISMEPDVVTTSSYLSLSDAMSSASVSTLVSCADGQSNCRDDGVGLPASVNHSNSTWTDDRDDNNSSIYSSTFEEDGMEIQYNNDANGGVGGVGVGNVGGVPSVEGGASFSETTDQPPDDNHTSTGSSLMVPSWSPNAGAAAAVQCFTPVEYYATDEWCRVYYFEYNTRVGDTFHCTSPQLTVDGFTDPNKCDRYCLGALTNVKRYREAEITRRHIGHGLTLFYLGGEVIVECKGESSIFVQSPNCNYMQKWHLATVVKVPSGCNLTIFNNAVFASLLNRHVNENYEVVFELGKMCVLRISFVKGWGACYKRQNITSTPCWIEVHLNGPLQWLDRVLQQMGSSQKGCSSKS